MSSFQAPGDFSLSESVGKRLMTPGGAVAPGVAPELMPVLVLENDRPENMLLSAQRMFARNTSVAANAGARSSVHLCNNRPDTLVVVDLITAATAITIGLIRGNIGAVPFGTQNFGMPLDTRITPSGLAITPVSSAILVADNTLSVGITVAVHINAANALCEIPFILGPADWLYVCATSDNLPVTNLTIQWRERRLNQSERL